MNLTSLSCRVYCYFMIHATRRKRRTTLLSGSFLSFGLAVSSLSQTVDFHNGRNFTTIADRLVRDVSGAPLVGTDYLAQLYYGAQGSSPGSLMPVFEPPVHFFPGPAGA